MRVSCNGCRVLRKGCSSSCSIRPCLQWIKNSECQANATLFLVKFYGRAGLLNLIDSSPHHQRSEVFRSLLYEACGRIVNPIHGSVGLLSSGNWHKCQAAVEAVLRGDQPITHGPPEASRSTPAGTAGGVPLTSRGIRHVQYSGRSKSSRLHRRRRRCCPIEGDGDSTTTSDPDVVDDEVELDLSL